MIRVVEWHLDVVEWLGRYTRPGGPEIEILTIHLAACVKKLARELLMISADINNCS